jgi:High potential iron-sulfur protein
MTKHDEATRRQILRAGLAVVGGAVAVGSAQAQDKIAQTMVQYQDTPKDGNKCDTCVNWEAPNSCKIVSGKISPNGWCIAYAPMENKKG